MKSLMTIIALAALNSLAAAAVPIPVNLAPVANVWAIATEGKAVQHNGIDGNGNAYSGNLLGAAVTWSGTTFTIGAPDVADAVVNVSVPLPAGSFTALQLLATGVDGNQLTQKFVVTYTDGTSATLTQNLSDWWTSQKYPGEAVAVAMPRRVTLNGTVGAGNYSLYAYSLPLDSSKTVKTLTLPANVHVAVLAVSLIPVVTSIPTTATVGLSWTAPTQNSDGSALTDLKGFNIYQGTSPTALAKVGTANAGVSAYATAPLVPGTYYFAVTSFNSANVESAQSAVVSTVVAPPPPKIPGVPSNVKITVTVTAGP